MDTKYKLGQRIFWLDNEKIKTSTVSRIVTTQWSVFDGDVLTNVEYTVKHEEESYIFEEGDDDHVFGSIAELVQDACVVDENGEFYTISKYYNKQ